MNLEEAIEELKSLGIIVNLVKYEESDTHLKAKFRIAKIMYELGFTKIEIEKKFPNELVDYFEQPLLVDYYIDVYGEILYELTPLERRMIMGEEIRTKRIKMHRAIGVEIDGKVGHSTSKALKTDKFRDIHFKEKKDIEIFHIPTTWIIGNQKIDTEIIGKDLLSLHRRYPEMRTLSNDS
jgi:hypothetical protein